MHTRQNCLSEILDVAVEIEIRFNNCQIMTTFAENTCINPLVGAS